MIYSWRTLCSATGFVCISNGKAHAVKAIVCMLHMACRACPHNWLRKSLVAGLGSCLLVVCEAVYDLQIRIGWSVLLSRSQARTEELQQQQEGLARLKDPNAIDLDLWRLHGRLGGLWRRDWQSLILTWAYIGLPQVMCAQLRMWCLTFLDKCTKHLSELGALLYCHWFALILLHHDESAYHTLKAQCGHMADKEMLLTCTCQTRAVYLKPFRPATWTLI